jgi:hypothetical protein
MKYNYQSSCVCGGSIKTNDSVYFSKWQTDHNARHAEKILSKKETKSDQDSAVYRGDGTCGTLFGKTYY